MSHISTTIVRHNSTNQRFSSCFRPFPLKKVQQKNRVHSGKRQNAVILPKHTLLFTNFYRTEYSTALSHTIIYINFGSTQLIMKSINKSNLILCILIPLAVGAFSSLFSGSMSMSYSSFDKPSFSPPSYLFPIVWTILYVLMGVSSYLIYSSDDAGKGKALTTYAIQLIFNFFWSILFFGFSKYLFAFIWLIALIILIAVMIYQFYKISPLAAYLQIPYLLWCVFAAYLNYTIYMLN